MNGSTQWNGKIRGICGTTYAGHVAAKNITLEQYAEELKIVPGVRYLCCGSEICPTTGRPHLQWYVYFTHAISFTQARSRLLGNLTGANGSASQNRTYCGKLDKEHPNAVFFEIGNMPIDSKKKGELEMYIILT